MYFSVVLKCEPVSSGPNVFTWVSISVRGCGRDVEVALADHVTLQRRKLRQIPERFVHGQSRDRPRVKCRR